ncbi:MAG: AAA-like domain-containing protein [Eubacteriales bacterium]
MVINMDINKRFNTTGDCKPKLHYMVDITDRLIAIKQLIDRGEYFAINRARQYGKTTILKGLERFLKSDYNVIRLDFQAFSHKCFESEEIFSRVFTETLQERYSYFTSKFQMEFESIAEKKDMNLSTLFKLLSKCCEIADKPVVLLIDEVDSASNNQVFLDFLAQLRNYYLDRDVEATFQSVILAGVYDIKNLKMKIHPNEPSKKNSPWNIAADFDISMSFSVVDITSMIGEYEQDYKTDMDISEISKLIYDYTSGYPFLVSRICKLIDEKVVGIEKFPNKTSAWTKEGFLQAVKFLLNEENTLFDSLIHKLYDYEKIRNLIYSLLFEGATRTYNIRNESIQIGTMFGFVKNKNGFVAISNRIFEIILYDQFLSDDMDESKVYCDALKNKNQFIDHGELDMARILEKFVQHFDDIYGNQSIAFKEEEGRKYFLLYLKPIINGVGNYYIEAQTRDMKRTDIIIDYLGKQYIIEMKIWHGEEYNTRGEQQLTEYLNYYHLEKGYMLSFNFNKNKQVGIKSIEIGEKILIEAVV